MPGLGRLPAPDPRDDRFPMRAAHALLGVDDRPIPAYLLHRPGPILDQGQTGTCVFHCWEAIHLGRPKERAPEPGFGPFDQYRQGVLLDEFPANDTEAALADEMLQYGTSVRAGAKLYARRGRIAGDYVWGRTAADGVRHVGLVGPCALGIDWLEPFFDPDAEGIIRITPTARIAGGHAIKWVGIDLTRSLAILQNSWGRAWGGWRAGGRRVHAGLCRIGLDDLDRLIRAEGELCAATEIRRAR